MTKLRIIAGIIFLSILIFAMTSCVVRYDRDNGYHKGWFHHREHRHEPKRTVLIIGGDNHPNRHNDNDK